MPKFLHDNQNVPDSVPAEGETPERETTETAAKDDGIYEEFDISSFDFTIADPGEIAEFSDTVSPSEGPSPEEERPDSEPELTAGEEPKEKKEKFSFGKITKKISQFSEKVSETASKLMEEKPEERPEKPRKKKERVAKEEKREREPKPPKQPRQRQKIHFTGGTFRQVSKRWMRYALRPAMLYENIPELLWPLFLVGTMLFFGAFYLMLGLDWYHAELVSVGRLWAIAGIGLLVGGTAAMAFAAGAQGLSLLCRKERLQPFRVLSSVAGACVYPSVLLVLGLLIQLIFKASVSMSFGLMAVLWMMFILLEVLRDLFGEKNLFKSTLWIILWGFLLFVIMSLTFTLK